MDGDLFRVVLLGLLTLGVVALVATLATLGGIRKALEQRASSTAAEPLGGPTTGAAGSGTAHELAAASGHDPAAAGTSQAASTPAQSEPAVSSAATGAGIGQADTIRGVLEQHGLQGSEAAATPLTGGAQQPAEQAQSQEQTVDSVFAAHADDPQEEPFQRDGRWWFRRGDELLLYDEASGQWQPAPGQATSGAGVAATAESTAPTQTQPAVTSQAQESATVADQVATYWKCPTCGAVNGSTAASCRMCFAARP